MARNLAEEDGKGLGEEESKGLAEEEGDEKEGKRRARDFVQGQSDEQGTLSRDRATSKGLCPGTGRGK